MRKARKHSTEFTSQKPPGPPEMKPLDPPAAEAPGEPSAPPRQFRGYLWVLLVWAIAFAFLVGLILLEGVADLFTFLRNVLGW